MKYVPVPVQIQVMAKAGCGILISAVCTWLMLIPLHVVLAYPLWLDALFILGSLLSIIMTNLFGVLIDLIRPKLIWEQEASAVKQNFNGFLSMMLSFVLAIAFAAPIILWPNAMPLLCIALLIIQLILTAALYLCVKKAGAMILIYLAEEAHKEDTIRRIAESLQLKVHFLSDEQTNVPLKILFGRPDTTGKPAALPHALMVMQRISDKQFTALNDAMKQQDAYIGRKAMRTAHNQHWTLARLSKEIEDEHRYFDQYEQLQQLMRESNTLRKEDYAAESWQRYEQTLIRLYMQLQKEQPSAAKLDRMLNEAKQVRDALRPIKDNL